MICFILELKGQSLTDFVKQGGLHSLVPREGKRGILDSEDSYEIVNPVFSIEIMYFSLIIEENSINSGGDVSQLFAPHLDAPREASKGRISLSSIKVKLTI